MTTELSDTKKFSLEVLNEFDELAQPEINNIVMKKLWDYVKNYAHKIVLRKPDKELESKLYKIYQKLHPKFQDIDLGVQMKVGEALGSPQVPNVGELAKKKHLVKMTDAETIQLLKDLEINF